MTHGGEFATKKGRPYEESAAAAISGWQAQDGKRPESGTNVLLHRVQTGKPARGQLSASNRLRTHGSKPGKGADPKISQPDILMTEQAEKDSWDFEFHDINRPKTVARPTTSQIKKEPWLNPAMTFGVVGEKATLAERAAEMRALIEHSPQQEWIASRLRAQAQASDLTLEDA